MIGQVGVKPTYEILFAEKMVSAVNGWLDLLKCCCQGKSHRGNWEGLYELQDVLDILQDLGRAIIYCSLYKITPTIVLLKDHFKS